MNYRGGFGFLYLGIARAWGIPAVVFSFSVSGAELRIPDSAGAFFGGTDTSFQVQVDGASGGGRLTWSLSSEAGVLSRGEQVVSATPGAPQTVGIDLRIPPVRPGIVFPVTFAAAWTDSGGETAAGHVERTLSVFPENPLAGRQAWANALKLGVFDPGHELSERLEELELPFQPVHNLESLPDLEIRLLVLGEGLILQQHPALIEQIGRAAAGGLPVLVLRMESGDMPLPGTSEDRLPAPAGMRFARGDIIPQLHKHLSPADWGADLTGGFDLQSYRGAVVGQVSEDADAWPWIEVRYPDPGAKLVFCHIPVLSRWESGPASRFLLVSMLEYMTTPEE